MIDANDKATQALALDDMPVKRGRGRPSTGKAMTPAEKQRAYRERQKGLRDQNSGKTANSQDGMWMTKEALESLTERQLQLSKELSEHVKRANKAEAKAEEYRLIAVEISERCKAAEDRVAELEKELKSRDQNQNSGNALEGVWSVQTKKAGAKTWVTEEKPLTYSHDGEPYDFAAMTGYVDAMNNGGHSAKFRAIRHDGLIYESEEKPRVKRHRDQPAAELIDNDE